MLQKGTAVVANTICGKHSSVRLASTRSASDLREPAQDGSRGSVSRKEHSLGLSRWQTHLEREGGRNLRQARCRNGCRSANPSAELRGGRSGPRDR